MTRKGMALSAYALATIVVISLLYVGQGVVMRLMYGSESGRDDDRARNARAQLAFLEYALAYRSDSILATTQRARGLVPGVRLVIDPALPSALSDPVASSLETMWGRVGGRETGSPVIIALLVDTAASIGGLARPPMGGQSLTFGYRLPSAEGAPCMVTIFFHRLPSRERLQNYGSVGNLPAGTGLCAFFRAFGFPGPGVRAWLSQTQYEAAGEARWWIARGRFERPLAEQERAEGRFERPFAGLGRARGPAPNLRSERRERIELLGCSAGDAESCERLVTTPRQRAERGWQKAALEEQQGILVTRRGEQYLGFFRSSRFLSDLVRDSGHERFERFWRSDQAMPVAFDRAFGETLEQHMEARIAGDYGTIARGAVVPWRTALVTILTSALLLAAAIVNARGWELR